MLSTATIIYQEPFPPNLDTRLADSIARGIANKPTNQPLCLFFRADDVAVPGTQFYQLIEIFKKYAFPLNMAVVPTWLTTSRWEQMLKITGNTKQWNWHQHGWLHKNHEPTGKKQEFGPSRSYALQEHDIIKGKHRIQDIMGKQFTPFFTPPWNRCSASTMEILKNHSYTGLSRFQNASPAAPKNIRDYPVNVDLHTRKDINAPQGTDNLLQEIEQAITMGYLGVMIHHQRMNKQAFIFLDLLLACLQKEHIIAHCFDDFPTSNIDKAHCQTILF